MKSKFMVLAVLCLLCTISYAQHQDCGTAFQICKNGTYHFDKMEGYGQQDKNLGDLRCFPSGNFRETNSLWLSWEAEKNGVISFIISPINKSDDIDFILFKATDSGCSQLEEVRCMASGETASRESQTRSANSPCAGSTGLSFHSLDEFESAGCKYSDDNLLKYLSVNKGEKYFLLVNNYDSTEGFSISFEGDNNMKISEACSSEESLNIVSIYPNPVKNVVNVRYNSIGMETKYTILDYSGRLVHSFTDTPTIGTVNIPITVDHLSSGAYLLQIDQGEITATKSFIKN